MNRRLWIWPLVAIVLIILQITSFGTFAGAVWFDLPLLFVYIFSMMQGAKLGGISGIILGLIQDVLTGGVFGFHILTRALIGFGCGSIKEIVYRNNYLYHAAFIFCISVGVRLFYLLPQYFLAGGLSGLFPYYLEITFAYALTNAVIAIPFGWILVRVDRWVKAGDLSY